MENSKLAQREIISALYRARNKKTHVNRKGKTVKGYEDSNLFPGGIIILKLLGHESLVHLDVDNMKLPRG